MKILNVKSYLGKKNKKEEKMEMLTEIELAEILKKSVQTLRNDRFLGRGVPYIKVGRSVRYLKTDVEEYIQKNRIIPNGK